MQDFQNHFKNVQTGDVIICSTNNPSSMIIKLFTSSIWGHCGIAIRIADIETNPKIVIDGGKLYVLDMSSGYRNDPYHKILKNGCGISEIDYIVKLSSKILVHKLKNIFKTESLIKYATQFINNNKNKEYGHSFFGYINLAFAKNIFNSYDNINFFCSQLCCEFYDYCIRNILKEKGVFLPEGINNIFGKGYPNSSKFFKPYHFSNENIDDHLIFEGNNLYKNKDSDLIFTIFYPILFCLIIVFTIYFTISP